jgi:AcrR family transcriptional regulator
MHKTELTERHAEVLRTAMYLIAERGLAGASLRELALRVGMSQPSLYHYFDTKDALVGQIIEWITAKLFHIPAEIPPELTLEELITAVCQFVLGLYSMDDYVTFVRFLFAISIERQEWSEVLRERFVEAGNRSFAAAAAPLLARGDIDEDDLQFAGRLMSSTMVLEMLNYRVLLREPMDIDRWYPEIDFLAETLAAGIRARTSRKLKEKADD